MTTATYAGRHRRATERLLTVDDAIIAPAILAEVYAGHEDFADRLAVMARLTDLDVPDLEHLCNLYGVDY